MDWQLFMWTSLIIMMAPGPNTVLIIQASIDRGMKAGIAILLGASLATAIYCICTGLGLAALITQTPFIFNAIKFLGCFYIMYLGVMGVYNGVTVFKERHVIAKSDSVVNKIATKSLLLKGFITGTLNVPMILIVLSVFPQFIVNKQDILQEWLILSGLYLIVQWCWYVFLICFLVSLRKYMLQPLIQATIKIVTSSLLIFLAVKIFVS